MQGLLGFHPSISLKVQLAPGSWTRCSWQLQLADMLITGMVGAMMHKSAVPQLRSSPAPMSGLKLMRSIEWPGAVTSSDLWPGAVTSSDL